MPLHEELNKSIKQNPIKGCSRLREVADSRTKVAIRGLGGDIKSCCTVVVKRVSVDIVTPPTDVLGMVLDSKEDNDRAESNTTTNTTTKNIVVLLPPGSLSLSDVVHEHIGQDESGSQVRQVVRSVNHDTNGEHNRVEVLTDNSSTVVLLKSPTWEHEKETNQETPLQNRVKTTKHLLRTNNTPNNRGGVECGGTRTGESLRLVRSTHSFDSVEDKVKSSHGNKTVDND